MGVAGDMEVMKEKGKVFSHVQDRLDFLNFTTIP
jgi:hypothetical protein